MSSTLLRLKTEGGISLEMLQRRGVSSCVEGRISWVSRVVAGHLEFLSSCNGDLRDPLVFPQESQVSIRIAKGLSGFLSSWCRGIRASSRVEARTSEFISSSDMDLEVSVEFQQGIQASSHVEAWNSASLSRCKRGVRLPVEWT